MPNHDTTRLHVIAPAPTEAALAQLRAFIETYTDLDAYEPVHRPGTIDEFTGKPLPERCEEPCFSHAFLPMPLEYRHTVSGSNRVAADDGRTWYEWANENWGTKWGTYSESHHVSDDRIVITFDSAWGPPWPLIGRVALTFDELTFEGVWFCEGDGMLRRFRVEDGDVLVAEIGEMHDYDEETDEFVKLLDLDGNPVDEAPTDTGGQ